MAASHQAMIFVIGGHGRLGSTLQRAYEVEGALSLDRSVYQYWWRDKAQDDVSRFFQDSAFSGSVIFVTSGILDPAQSLDAHTRVNYLLPRNVIQGATKLGLRVVTFGTVMERLLSFQNAYVRSKTSLGRYVAELGQGHGLALHVRLHTLYGVGQPSSFMFLGQVLDALRKKVPFRMTLGKQLREYHHVEDDVRAVQCLVAHNASGSVDLSHGQPVRLGLLASGIFQAFAAENLLHIGSLAEPTEENYSVRFDRPEALEALQFRATIPAVVEYLKALAPQEEPAK